MPRLPRIAGWGAGAGAQLCQFNRGNENKNTGADPRKVFELAVGLNAYIYLAAPDVIVQGGGLPGIRQGLFVGRLDGYQVKVKFSTLGEQAGLYGAASLWE